MSTPIDDGGPAFPQHGTFDPTLQRLVMLRSTFSETEGLSLRDYFAAKALAGICAAEDNRVCPLDRRESVEEWREELYAHDAMTAYRYADAMIEARKQPKP